MQQYFIESPHLADDLTMTDPDTRKHIFTVMRLDRGDQVILVAQDGQKGRYTVTDKDQARFQLLEKLEAWSELPIQVTIACGFSKGDKLDLIAQKATELGASAIWGFKADWSIVKWDAKKLSKRQDKYLKIAKGAAQQSKRNFIPDVQLFDKKANLITHFEDFDQVVIAYEESAKEGERTAFTQTLKTMQPGQKLLIIFGPEGGLSPSEITTFQAAGGRCIGLGPRILRAETAPFYALSSISYAFELN